MKNIANILLGLACMIGIPVSAHFISAEKGPAYALVAGSLVDKDSSLPRSETAGLSEPARIYHTSSAEYSLSEVESFRDFFRVNLPAKAVLGESRRGRKITSYFFPGRSDKTAIVIGGVHGSELSSIDVAMEVVATLQKGKSLYYNVIVIPCLFPDNAQEAEMNPSHIGSPANIGRYSSASSVDPNRQMPALGRAPDFNKPADQLGRRIENENQMLLEVIAELKPARIVNIHAIRNPANAGIYADPRTTANGIALGFESDSSLAIEMASFVSQNGGDIEGNQLKTHPSAVYLKDPRVVPAGMKQPRNLCGAKLKDNRGTGVSLGGWASTAVCDHQNPSVNRPAIRLFTMEFPGYKSPRHITDMVKRKECIQNVSLYAASITDIFLQDKQVEPVSEPCDRQ